jgi:hypothetical protein
MTHAKRGLGVGTILLGLGLAGAAHATSITVWAYGDGETVRMMSELTANPTSTVHVVDRSQASTGPDGATPLANRIYADLVNLSPWPTVIHIGYNASASSQWNCATQQPKTILSVATAEAQAIMNAANFVSTNTSIKVLLSKGPGTSDPSPYDPCMREAFNDVTYLLAYYAGQYPWVDYSGYTAGAGTGGWADPNLKLLTSVTGYWESDGLHISCDIAHFNYSQCKVVTSATRPALGSYRVSRTVLKAYQSFQ